MTDGLSMLLIQWAELERKFSEFHEIITLEGNDMNVMATKKVLSDLKLEWEELDQKTNIILQYEWQYNGVLNISCPPVSLSDCNRNNDSTHGMSQSKNGMASEDPVSLSTVCNGIHGDYHSSLTSDNQMDENNIDVVLYYPLYSGWDFPEYLFLFKNPNQVACWAISRFKRDGLGNIWGQGKYPPFLRFVGQVKMRRSEVQVALESPPTFKSKIEHHFFSQVIFHLPKKDSILLSSDYVQLSKETFVQCAQGFCNNEPDYQQSLKSIYRDEERFRCHNMTINSIHKMFDVTLHQKVSQIKWLYMF